MAFIQMHIIVLGFFAMAAADAGERNIETLRKFFKDAEILQGKTLDKELMDKVAAQLGSLAASKIDCKATAESPVGFDLYGASFAECCDACLLMNLGMKTLDWSIDFAVLEGSGGRAVLAWQPTEVELPSGERLRQNIASKFEFDDSGKISKWSQELDTTALVADVGKKNLAAVLKVFDDAKVLLQGSALSPQVLAELVSKLASSYAPTIDCSMSPASSFGFDLKGVPIQACLAEMQNFLGAAKQVDWSNDAIAAVPSSGGRTILLWQKNALDVDGLPLTMNNAFKVDFNLAGLITGWSQELDTAAVVETRARAASLASGASLAVHLSSLTLSGFFVGCLVSAVTLTLFAAGHRRLGSSEGYHRLAV